MNQFKKTLQDGTPDGGDTSRLGGPGPGSAPVSPPPRPIQQSSPGSAPVSPYRAPAPSSPEEVPPSSIGYVPPTPKEDELRRSRPPPGHRTPSATRVAPNFGPPLPENAPGWMLRARRMSLALEETIRNGTASPTIEACIERAWAAWELDGSVDRQISRIARLISKAHSAIRETPAQDLERAYGECAQVLWAGLPRHVKGKQDFAQTVQIVRSLRMEADPWAAVVDATSRLLGWTQASRAHAAHAIRVALLAEQAV